MHAPPPHQQHYRPNAPPMTSSVATGKTPIAKRTRASRRANDPSSSTMAPPNNNPPPQQQQIHNNNQQPPQMMRNAADDAIAKRRAELRRLQQQRGKSAGIAERLSQSQQAKNTTYDHHNRGRAAAAPMMRSAVVTTNNHPTNNNTNSRFGAAATAFVEASENVRLATTARRLDESYNTIGHQGNGVANNDSSYGASATASQKMSNLTQAPMAAKRTSEIFPPNASSNSRGKPSNKSTNMTIMGSTKNNNGHQYQQASPPAVVPQTIKAPPKHHHQQQQQYSQQPAPVQSPNSIQSTSSFGSTSNKSGTATAKSSPFGQARVTKVISALSLSAGNSANNGNNGGVKSLVPPLNMLDVPSLVDDDNDKAVPVKKKIGGGAKKNGGGGVRSTAAATTANKKVPLKRVGDATKLPLVKDDGVTIMTKEDKMSVTPREQSDGEETEVIDSGKSTPIHTNRVEKSPLESVAADSTKVGDDGSKSQAAAIPLDVSATLQEAKMALVVEQKVDDANTTATTTTTKNDSRPKQKLEEKVEEKVKDVENHQPPQSKKEQENNNHVETVKNGNTTNNGKNKLNLSRLKLDLERSEKEKLEALEQVAKLKSLLEAGGGVGSNGNNNGETSSRSTIDSPRSGPTPRNGGGGGFGFGGINTPRGGGGGTPKSRGGRAGVPPLGWGTPRSGNSRAGNSRSGSPERGHHHHPYGLMMSGTPRMRASPLPKQFNRVISDTPLNKKGEADADDGAAATPQEERVEEEFLTAAARSIPNEYGTPLASYFVRRPHVTDDSLERNETDQLAKLAIDLWGNNCTHLSSGDDYKKNASVFKPESLEIVACIEADGSVFTLSGECNARHGKVSTMSSSFDEDDANIVGMEYEWSIFDNVEEMDRALGRVSYIDEEGNEREYWLDSIYEEALTTRESYCTSMISSAFTLKEVRGPLAQKREQPASWNQTIQSQPMPMQSFVPAKSTLDGSVNMSHPPLNQQHVPQSNANAPQNQSQRSDPLPKVEMPTNPAKKVPLTSETESKASSTKEETKQKQSPPPEEYEPSDSALTVMVVALFSFFFKLSWLVIKTPFRIASMILTFWIMLIAVRVLCLFLADDNGAWDIGAGVEYEYNMPGIY